MTINADRKIISLTGPNCSFANTGACRVDVVGGGGTSGGTAALAWSASSLSAGQTLTITTDGTYLFGATGPSVAVYDEFAGGSVGSAISLTSPAIGEWSSTNNSPAYASNGRDGGTCLRALYQNSTPRQLRKNFSNTQEVFVCFAVYTGTDVGGETLSDFPNSSHWKQTWFSDDRGGSAGISNGDGLDIAFASHNGTGSTAVTGNETGAGQGIWYLGNAGSNNSARWDFSGWNFLQYWSKADATNPSNNPSTNYAALCNTNVFNENTDTTVALWKCATDAQLNTAFVPGWAGNFTGSSANIEWKYDMVYIATGSGAAARVLIGDSSTFAACRDIWIAPPTAWSNNSVSVRIPSTLSGVASKYVYLFDASNTLVNSTGLQLV